MGREQKQRESLKDILHHNEAAFYLLKGFKQNYWFIHDLVNACIKAGISTSWNTSCAWQHKMYGHTLNPSIDCFFWNTFFPSTKLPINVLGYCTLRRFFYTGILVAYLTFNFLQQFVCKYYYSHCSSPYIVNIHTCSKILNLYVPLVTILFFFSRRNATKCFSFSFVSHYVFFTRIDLDFVGCLSLIYILIFFSRIFVDV